jgi:hypothetical protein
VSLLPAIYELGSVFFCKAREDAFGIRERMVVSKPNRVNDGFEGPSPTQRAKSSIDEVRGQKFREIEFMTSLNS